MRGILRMDIKELRAFQAHGAVFEYESGVHGVGMCPFCTKTRHFYVNKKNKCWDCKKCGEKGNLVTFLERIVLFAENLLNSKPRLLRALAKERGMPKASFTGWGLGWNRRQFILPVYDLGGHLIDVRRYVASKRRWYSTPGCKAGLLGVESLKTLPVRDAQMWVCEGEWDAMALRWLLERAQLRDPVGVVSVPGADIWKPDFTPATTHRHVTLAYDHDETGERGIRKAYAMICNFAASVRALQWPSRVRPKYDINDYIKKVCVNQKRPKRCWKTLRALTRLAVRHSALRSEGVSAPGAPGAGGSLAGNRAETARARPVPKISRADLEHTLARWLRLPGNGREHLAVIMGTVLANVCLEGDPVWVFIVGPPGSAKTELLQHLAASEHVVHRTSLTQAALVSGMPSSGAAGDPSLMPQLHKKVLVIKDFTEILALPSAMRDDIFAQFRQAYDGKVEKHFGAGGVKKCEANFGMLAGVTHRIDTLESMSDLGERFLRYRLMRARRLRGDDSIVIAAMGNVNRELQMRYELEEKYAGYLHWAVKRGVSDRVSTVTIRKIAAIAELVGKLRGVVPVDKYRDDIHLGESTYEVPTRLAKQLLKLGMGVGAFLGKPVGSPEVLRIVRTVARHTIPPKTEMAFELLWYERSVTKQLLNKKLNMTNSTAYRELCHLAHLNLVVCVPNGNRHVFHINRRMLELVKKSRIFPNIRLLK